MPDLAVYVLAAGVALLAGIVVLVVLLAMALGRLRALDGDREAAARESARLRGEVGERLNQFTGTTQQQLRDFGERLTQFTQLTRVQLKDAADSQDAISRATSDRLAQLREASEQRLEAVRQSVEQRLDLLRNDNAHKLEQMRATVDEKLQQTLEARLGESFKLVSDRLEQVHRGLGEMQSLAAGVGDLKRVLTNVKSRGTWGEMQLGSLLADMLTPQQFGTNVETVPGSNRRVEFAIRMPARADDPPCWIPVDSKFPVEEWERLQQALDRADAEAAEQSRKSLAQSIRFQARKVRDSYVCPPHTSDFAFLFVPTESLYAELMSRPGLSDELQREFKVTLAGPMNFLALLNIVQIGFQRASIEQRSAETWRLLGAVRTEFGKFGEVLKRAQRKLQEASDTLDEAGRKTTTIARKLRDVQSLPEPEAARLLSSTPLIDLAPDADPPPDDK